MKRTDISIVLLVLIAIIMAVIMSKVTYPLLTASIFCLVTLGAIYLIIKRYTKW